MGEVAAAAAAAKAKVKTRAIRHGRLPAASFNSTNCLMPSRAGVGMYRMLILESTYPVDWLKLSLSFAFALALSRLEVILGCFFAAVQPQRRALARHRQI